MFEKDPVMNIIDRNLSYKDRRRVISIMAESIDGKDRVYANIGKFFLKRINKLNLLPSLSKYNKCNGDITRSNSLETMQVSLQFLKSDSNMDIAKSAMVIDEALLNLRTRKKSFELGFKVKESEIAKLLFGAIHKACVAGTSVLINESSLLNPGITKRERFSHIAIDGLSVFNKYCKDGTVDKALRYDLNIGGRAVKEGVFDDAVSIVASVASALITAIRSLVYWVYYTRMDMADYLELQAAYIEMNRISLQNRQDLTEDQKKEIIRKQAKWQERLLKLADMIQLDDVKAARKAKADADKDGKEVSASDATRTSEDVLDFF